MVPHIVLEEIGVPFRRVLVDRTTGGHKTPGFLKLNPNGLIPVLVDGGHAIYETAAITLHLCDTHPQAALAPAPASVERGISSHRRRAIAGCSAPTCSGCLRVRRYSG